ncbi:phosphotransferase [Heyndrickxia acidicola]|uniref:Phosphotransferase n=1 Tax=Heyndrickxia acidicola TaxID=209389 RepID=A0ABU6MJS8_9BACI|nr:phosphotransferase [Heyndrickxia acidicola]MED1204770.1 phosphotransferase [Heyndrickxia acidicola]
MYKGKQRGEDDEQTRLLFFLRKTTNEDFTHMYFVKKGVWMVFSQSKTYILKEFPSTAYLNNQLRLTERLHDHSFTFTYQFHPFHHDHSFEFDKKVYGLIDYIKPSALTQTYSSSAFRKEALMLLKAYHYTTGHFSEEFKPYLPVFCQMVKWQQRLKEFKIHLSDLQAFVPAWMLTYYVSWSEWSLEKIKPVGGLLKARPHCIIHGDVAHHNFLKGEDKKLYLIDFDLISLAPEIIDDLQFSNRILPYLSWSLEQLFEYPPLKKYRNSEDFLHALIFPTDVLREWNRFFKSPPQVQKEQWSYINDLTVTQFPKRKAFVERVLQTL